MSLILYSKYFEIQFLTLFLSGFTAPPIQHSLRFCFQTMLHWLAQQACFHKFMSVNQESKLTRNTMRGCSQIMSAAKGGGWKMLTMADKGGSGVNKMLTTDDEGGRHWCLRHI